MSTTLSKGIKYCRLHWAKDNKPLGRTNNVPNKERKGESKCTKEYHFFDSVRVSDTDNDQVPKIDAIMQAPE